MKRLSLCIALIIGLIFFVIAYCTFLGSKIKKGEWESYPLIDVNAEVWIFDKYNHLLEFLKTRLPKIDFEANIQAQPPAGFFENGLCLYRIGISENVILYMMDPVFAEPSPKSGNEPLEFNRRIESSKTPNPDITAELIFGFFYQRESPFRLWASFSVEDSSLYVIGSDSDLEFYRDMAYAIYSLNERLGREL